MQTQKEALLLMLNGEKTDVIIDGYAPFQLIFDDLLISGGMPKPGGSIINAWGVKEIWEEGQPGPLFSEAPGDLVCEDVTEWRTCVKKPNVRDIELDWHVALGQKAQAHTSDKLAMAFMPVGVFETLHAILGFEECLIDLLTEPEDTKALTDLIFEYKMDVLKRHIEGWQPDWVLMQDDFGSADSLLMPPAVWRAFFKEGYRKLCAYAHANHVRVMLHSDSCNELIAADLEEVGIDIWQGVLPSCDICGMQKKLPGNMLFMGGMDSGVFDMPGASKEVIRKEAIRACREYLTGGRFIPSITYGAPGALMPGVDAIISETIASLNADRTLLNEND